MSTGKILLGVLVAIGCLIGFLISTLCIYGNSDEQDEHTCVNRIKAFVILLGSSMLQCAIIEVAILDWVRACIITVVFFIVAICINYLCKFTQRI